MGQEQGKPFISQGGVARGNKTDASPSPVTSLLLLETRNQPSAIPFRWPVYSPSDERVLVELVELWYEGHRPQNHRALRGFSGRGIRPTPEGATGATSTTGKWRQTGQVRTRGQQVEYRVVGGVSCVKASGTILGGVGTPCHKRRRAASQRTGARARREDARRY